MASPIKPSYNILVMYKGNLIQTNKQEYLRMVRNEADHLKLIGKVVPINKTDITWKNVIIKRKTIHCKHFTNDHVTQLFNLVNKNLDYLTNKGSKNFLQNFHSLVINKMKKPFNVVK